MPEVPSFERICFIISPIGRVGTPTFDTFKEVLDFVIKPAVQKLGSRFEVIRADEIERPGSFIRDILEHLYGAHVVIADLTGQNPNVFYELGVRHSLSPRTILIAQQLDDIPSDLREYRTIIYDTTPKGVAQFAERVSKFLTEILDEPERPDNPVLDRLGGLVNKRVRELEAEVRALRGQLERVLQRGEAVQTEDAPGHSEPPEVRLARVLKILGAERQLVSGHFSRAEESFSIPAKQGHFQLYYVTEGTTIKRMLYVAMSPRPQLDRELADARVLMEDCARAQTGCTFVIVTGENWTSHKKKAQQDFAKLKSFVKLPTNRDFALEIWDAEELNAKELEIGIRVPARARSKRKPKAHN